MSEDCCHDVCCGHEHKRFQNKKHRIRVLIIAAILCVVSYFWDDILGDAYAIGKYFNPAWAVVFICGAPLVVDGFKGLFKNKKIGTSLLISVVMFACIALEILCWCGVALDEHVGSGHDHSNLFSAAEIAFIMLLGEFLEDLSVSTLTGEHRHSCSHGDVEHTEVKKTGIERTVDKWAGVIVPSAIVFSALVFVLVFIVLKEDWHVALTRAMTVLVVFCPCSLVLSTPTAVVAGIRNLNGKGVKVKSGSALERIATVNAVVIDTVQGADVLRISLKERNIETINFSDGLSAKDKTEKIVELRREGKVVCYVGDGKADFSVFSAADVSMLTGSDKDSELADIDLGGGAEKAYGVMRFGKRVLAVITANIVLAVVLNVASVVLSLFGYLDPVIGSLVHNGGTILVVADSALLLTAKLPLAAADENARLTKGD